MQHVDPDQLALLALGETLAERRRRGRRPPPPVRRLPGRGRRAAAHRRARPRGRRASGRPCAAGGGVGPDRGRGGIGIRALPSRHRARPASTDRRARGSPYQDPAPLGAAGRGTRRRRSDRRRRHARRAAALAVRPGAGDRLHGDPRRGRRRAARGQRPRRRGPRPGGPQLEVTAHGLPLQQGYYEVWVFDGERNMVSLGVLGADSTASLPLPPTLDLRTYHVVDISQEPLRRRPDPLQPRACCAAPSRTERARAVNGMPFGARDRRRTARACW